MGEDDFRAYLEEKFRHLELLITMQAEEERMCRAEVNDRLHKLEVKKPFNPSWIYATALTLICLIEAFRFLHWLK